MRVFGVTIWLMLVVFNITVGAWSVYEILSWFGKSIPTLAEICIGLFVAEISIPIAVVGAILRAYGLF